MIDYHIFASGSRLDVLVYFYCLSVSLCEFSFLHVIVYCDKNNLWKVFSHGGHFKCLDIIRTLLLKLIPIPNTNNLITVTAVSSHLCLWLTTSCTWSLDNLHIVFHSSFVYSYSVTALSWPGSW